MPANCGGIGEGKSWFLYVIVNGQGIAYTGISTDVERRLASHNKGTGAKFTRGRGPWTLVYCEGPFDRAQASRREVAVKRDGALKAALKA